MRKARAAGTGRGGPSAWLSFVRPRARPNLRGRPRRRPNKPADRACAVDLAVGPGRFAFRKLALRLTGIFLQLVGAIESRCVDRRRKTDADTVAVNRCAIFH